VALLTGYELYYWGSTPQSRRDDTMAMRLRELLVILFCLPLCSCERRGQPAPTQQPSGPPTPAHTSNLWLKRLPQRSPDELTFNDFVTAFEAQARLTAAPREDVRPIRDLSAEGLRQKAAAEQENLFRRWEWFTRPRVYPTNRWDGAKVFAEFARVRAVDTALIAKASKFAPPGPLPKWDPLGPSDAIGGTNVGRVNAIAFDPSSANVIYIGTANGGLWKSADNGATWSPLTDTLPTLSIGDVAIDPITSTNVYVATGDAFGYGNPFWGGTYSMGVWKSSDGGNTWKATGLTLNVAQNRTIRRLTIHPSDPKILLAATSDGLFRTDDGGVTWMKVWNSSAFDVEFTPDDGSVVYATTDRVIKSTDGGKNFVPLATTCADARYNIEIARADPRTLYTLCSNGAVQKSVDGGATWRSTADPGAYLYGYYDNVLAVSPVDSDVVVVAGSDIKKTTNGGASWVSVPTAGHVDNHCVRFAPHSSTAVLVGNDGGLFRTSDGGNNWTSLNKGLAITQFYRLGLSRATPGLMVAGAQDNGNMRLSAAAWTNISGADGMGGFIDFANDNNVYAAIQRGALYRSTDSGNSWTPISTPSEGAWVTPFDQSRTVATTIYAATDKVYKSTDQGTSWNPISSLLPGTGPLTILRLHANPDLLLAGDGQKLYRTTDGGSHWTDITGTLPVSTNYLTDVVASENDQQTLWATFSGYNAGQKVYKSTDGGVTWVNISGSLPNVPVNCIVWERKAKNPIYIGTDSGVYYIEDGLPDFVPFKRGLPNVIVDELEIQYGTRKIIAATYGRGVWQSDLRP
jgi:photosystem II stability/assembly factor-like uncharacterized protein